MRTYNTKALRIEFAAPHTKVFVIDLGVAFIGFVLHGFRNDILDAVMIGASLIIFALAMLLLAMQTTAQQIKHKVCLGLFYFRYGNPLGLKNGEYLPKVKVIALGNEKYLLTIHCTSVAAEKLNHVSTAVSSALNKKQEQYAVTVINTDVALNYVEFTVEDVTVDKSLSFYSVEEMRPVSPTKIAVQKGDSIDLTTSGSILVAGKTRSGKTTAVISILLQALLCGRDDYRSAVVIIDPKCAELSVLPYVVTVDEDGEARKIMQALKDFESVRVSRQKVLNELSLKTGDAIHWWECGMHPSFLFIDEYVSCRSLFHNKAGKNSDRNYSLASYEGYIRRLATMGASSGCFLVISIAEASVEEGGLPSMIRNAMSTKILFKPTLTEGRLIWNSSKLENFPERVYQAGDCWFSSTDGMHDDVIYCHFPHLRFPVYKELGRLLSKYYGDSADGGSPQDGARPPKKISYQTSEAP